ncbi:MAG: cation:proton antiporter [Bacteroidetes bacterium]|nr:cation:proton antiporter [Bacteroidota bacterium]
MDVAIFFALMGGIILVGFLANLLFKLTKIPSVLLLMAIGVFLGPVTGWIASDALLQIAPYFGTMALLIILFEGGLELDIRTVVQQAPKAAVLAVGVFVVSVGLVMLFCMYVMELSILNSLILAAILGAISPAICIPVVQGLSVRDEIKTIVKLESALGEVLLIVSVLLLVDIHTSGSQSVGTVIMRFVISFGVAFVVASIAGVLWSRLIGWMGKEPLAYMLTLGFMFLLYFAVEEMHGSAAIAVLMFGLVLENMQVMANKIGERLRHFFGIDIKSEKFILNQFIKNITEEISFLLRTFFFVYLGLLLDFNELTWTIGLFILGMTALLLIGRRLMMYGFRRMSHGFTEGELQTIMAMLPRGLATAVMALLPFQQARIPGTELFPLYAFGVIVLTNIYMTGSIIFAERRLRAERQRGELPLAVGYAGTPEPAIAPMQATTGSTPASLADLERIGTSPAHTIDDTDHTGRSQVGHTAESMHREEAVHREEPTGRKLSSSEPTSAGKSEAAAGPEPVFRGTMTGGEAPEGDAFSSYEQTLFSADIGFKDEPPPQNFTDWMARIFGIHIGDRERGYLEAYRAAHISEPLFWVQVALATAITTLGLILDQSAIIIGGSLIMPIMYQILAAGLSLASGEIYLLLRIAFKMVLVMLLVVILSALLSDVLPFAEVTGEIASRTRPTIIDFLIALFGGMAGAAMLSRKNRFVQFLPSAIIAITLLPPLTVMGFSIANGFAMEIFRGAALLFTANLFANILGAMIVFLLVGMPKAAGFESVRRWKEQELTHPIISAVFEKLRLSTLVGRTGSVRARVIVIGFFLLLILIPLQSALNQLTVELRARQAITKVAELFDIKHRSTILNSSSSIGEDQIEVKLQVATNSFFTSEDIRRFEERVRDRTGIPTRLNLVQTLSDIGEGSTVRGLLTPDLPGIAPIGPRTFAAAIGDLRFQAQSILRSLPLSRRIDIVSMNAELTLDTLSPALNFVYLSDAPLTEDAQDILSTLIAGRISMPGSSIQFSWIDRERSFAAGGSPTFGPTEIVRLNNLQSQLAKFPQLSLDVHMPKGRIRSYNPDRFRQELREHLPLAADSQRVRFLPMDASVDSVYLFLNIQGNIMMESRSGPTSKVKSLPDTSGNKNLAQ